MMPRGVQSIVKWGMALVLVTVVVAYCLFPFIWTVMTALKRPDDIFTLPIRYWPRPVSMQNFTDVFQKRPFGQYVINSLIVATGGTLLTLLVGAWIAYPLRQMPLARAMRIQRWMLVAAIVPPTLLVIPLFVAVRWLGLVNQYPGLMVAYTVLNLPFAVWMLHAGFRRIPYEIDHAALIDGLSRWAILFRMILPLSKPTLAVTAVLVFIFCWNEFLIALTLMPDQSRYTVPVGIAMLSGASIYEIPWGEINAAVTLTTVPVILLIALLQRWILEGLTAGAVKG